ncbi:EpsG family protein [Spirochaetota bacterium]
MLFVPSAIRYGIGTDYVNYLDIFNRIKAGGTYHPKEFGWEILNIFAGKFALPFQFVIAFASFFTIFPFFKTEKKYFFIVIVLFSCLYYLNSFNITRQVLAMSILWYAYLNLLKKEYANAFVLVFLAAAFHNYALIFFVVFVIAQFLPLNKKRMLIIFLIFVASYFVISKYLIPVIMGYKYSGETLKFYTQNNISVPALFKSIPRCLVLGFMVFFINEDQNEKRELNYVYWLILGLAISDFLGISFLIIQRFRIYFFMAYLGAFKILILNTDKKEKIANLVFISFIIANYLVRFLWIGSAEVIPYTTIFAK